MRRFTDRAGAGWTTFESVRAGGLPDRRAQPAVVTVAFQSEDGDEVSIELPLGVLEGLSDEALILLLTRSMK